jgi:protease II
MQIYRNKLYPFIKYESVLTKFSNVTHKIDFEIKRFLKNRENSNLNQKNKFDYVGSFLKTKNMHISTLKTHDSQIILDDSDKAETLAEFFESTFSSKTTNHSL